MFSFNKKKALSSMSMVMLSAVVFLMGGVNVASARTITKTIVVPANTVWDGKGETIHAVGMGDGSQNEHQKPIFTLQKGAVLKNVRIAAPGCDGVHCVGNNTVENVVWEDIGEDALTVNSGANAGTINVRNCQSYKGRDKVIQVNAPCTLKVKNFYADGMGKFIRQNGGTTFKCTFYLEDCTVKNATECVARTDSKTTQLYYHNLKTSNIRKTLWMFPSKSQIHQY